MKTGGNNPDKRQTWSLSYKTNFNCSHFSKAHQSEEQELRPCGCRICFSLSGYLIQWQMTTTPPVRQAKSLSLIVYSLCFPHTFTKTPSRTARFQQVYLLSIYCHKAQKQCKTISFTIQNILKCTIKVTLTGLDFFKKNNILLECTAKENLYTQNMNQTVTLKGFRFSPKIKVASVKLLGGVISSKW